MKDVAAFICIKKHSLIWLEYNPDNGDAEGIYDYGNERLNYYDQEEESYSYLYDGKGNVT